MDKIKPAHIGKTLRKYVTDNRIFQANWARAQGINQRTIARYFKRESMQVETLFTICQVLNYNFISDIARQLPADMPPRTNNPLLAEIDLLKKENEKLKDQVAFLKEMMGVRK